MKKLVFALSAAMMMGVMAEVPYQIGVAGYTFHKKTLDETLEIMQKADVHYLCVKDFHLKYDASDAEIAAFKEKCAKYGVIPYALRSTRRTLRRSARISRSRSAWA